MRKLLYTAFLSAVVLSLGCAVTNYTLITDSAGPYGGVVVDSFYDKAYIIPSGQVATTGADGSDELYSLVVQDWDGDRRISTYSNFDPTSSVLFLDQQYCDPTRQSDCALTVADDPELPDAYPFSSSPINPSDDVFDYTFDTSCSGASALSLLLSQTSRIGECGSGFWADKQVFYGEFANLDITDFQGLPVYDVKVNNVSTAIELSNVNGELSAINWLGTSQAYLDSQLRMIWQKSPVDQYNIRQLESWVAANGNDAQVNITYGSLTADLNIKLMPLG